MENTNETKGINQIQFEFKLLRADIKKEFDNKVEQATKEMNEALKAKIKEFQEEYNRKIMEVCKSEDEAKQTLGCGRKHIVASPYIDETGKKWVRVKDRKYDFLLDINDLTDHEVKWDDAMQLVKDNGVTLPTKEMWSLVGAFLPEINAVIEQLGGDILDDWYWSASECSSGYAWIFNASYGYLDYNYKVYGYSCRGSLAFNS